MLAPNKARQKYKLNRTGTKIKRDKNDYKLNRTGATI